MTAYDLPEDWYQPSTEEYLALEKARMDHWFWESEYMCEFGEAEAAFFREDDLRRALTLKDLDEPPMFPESCAS